MKVYCVCIEEEVDEGELFRVEIFSTIEKATLYFQQMKEEDSEIVAEIVEYEIDHPESGDTTYLLEDSDYTESDSYQSSSE